MIDVSNFEEIRLYELELLPMEFDVGGGKITKEEIDTIKNYPAAKSLKVSGLNQETFEYLIKNYGSQFEAIAFHKNKLVSDLSLLGSLPDLKYVYYFFNQRVTKLWDMNKNVNLIGLAIYDFCKLHSIEEISSAPNLKYFAIGDAVWAGSKIESLKPIVNSSITHFAWWGDKVLDNDFLCLAASRVKELDLNVCRFKMDELAQLVACIPDLKGSAIQPYREGSIVKADKTETTYFYLCKGKRNLIKGKDDQKLEKYIREFETIVEQYRR